MAASKPISTPVSTDQWKRAGLIILAILAITIIAMRIEGRVWWCECRTPRVWISDVWSPHCSQHLLDPYSFAHFSHGLIFFSVLALVVPRMSLAWRLCIAVGLAAGWEILENSPMIINRFRTATMSDEYLGDSAVNAVGDVLCCFAGFFVARWLGLWKTVLLFLALEITLAFWIRDSLLLTTVMLISPIEAIKTWQSAAR